MLKLLSSKALKDTKIFENHLNIHCHVAIDWIELALEWLKLFPADLIRRVLIGHSEK